MKKILLVASVLLCSISNAQNIGTNGTNFFDIITPADYQTISNSCYTFTLRYRFDKQDDFQKLVELSKIANINIVFTLNPFLSSTSNLLAINNIIAAGIKIITLEAFNEYYSASQSNFNFTTYKSKF